MPHARAVYGLITTDLLYAKRNIVQTTLSGSAPTHAPNTVFIEQYTYFIPPNVMPKNYRLPNVTPTRNSTQTTCSATIPLHSML